MCAVILCACDGPGKPKNQLVGIDVSSSAKKNLKTYSPPLTEAILDSYTDQIIFYIFSYDSFEVYSGKMPSKDRDISLKLDLCVSKSQDLNSTRGTNFINMLKFISKRIKNNSILTLYTDGYFEYSESNDNQIQSLLSDMKSRGLNEVQIFGIDIKNKEKIYGWFESSGIKVIYQD